MQALYRKIRQIFSTRKQEKDRACQLQQKNAGSPRRPAAAVDNTVDNLVASVAKLGLGAHLATYTAPAHKVPTRLCVTIPALAERQSQLRFDMSSLGDALPDLPTPEVVAPVDGVAKEAESASGGNFTIQRITKSAFNVRTLFNVLPALRTPADNNRAAHRQSAPSSADESSSSEDGGCARSKRRTRASPYARTRRMEKATATDPAIDLFFASLIRATSLDDPAQETAVVVSTAPRGQPRTRPSHRHHEQVREKSRRPSLSLHRDVRPIVANTDTAAPRRQAVCAATRRTPPLHRNACAAA